MFILSSIEDDYSHSRCNSALFQFQIMTTSITQYRTFTYLYYIEAPCDPNENFLCKEYWGTLSSFVKWVSSCQSQKGYFLFCLFIEWTRFKALRVTDSCWFLPTTCRGTVTELSPRRLCGYFLFSLCSVVGWKMSMVRTAVFCFQNFRKIVVEEHLGHV